MKKADAEKLCLCGHAAKVHAKPFRRITGCSYCTCPCFHRSLPVWMPKPTELDLFFQQIGVPSSEYVLPTEHELRERWEREKRAQAASLPPLEKLERELNAPREEVAV